MARTLARLRADARITDYINLGVVAKWFPRPAASRGHSAFPQIRFLSLGENGTHVLFASRKGSYATGEITLAKQVSPALRKGWLCLADRGGRVGVSIPRALGD